MIVSLESTNALSFLLDDTNIHVICKKWIQFFRFLVDSIIEWMLSFKVLLVTIK